MNKSIKALGLTLTLSLAVVSNTFGMNLNAPKVAPERIARSVFSTVRDLSVIGLQKLQQFANDGWKLSIKGTTATWEAIKKNPGTTVVCVGVAVVGGILTYKLVKKFNAPVYGPEVTEEIKETLASAYGPKVEPGFLGKAPDINELDEFSANREFKGFDFAGRPVFEDKVKPEAKGNSEKIEGTNDEVTVEVKNQETTKTVEANTSTAKKTCTTCKNVKNCTKCNNKKQPKPAKGDGTSIEKIKTIEQGGSSASYMTIMKSLRNRR